MTFDMAYQIRERQRYADKVSQFDQKYILLRLRNRLLVMGLSDAVDELDAFYEESFDESTEGAK